MKIHTIGDPHLGRVFRNGVPLERRGEREESVWKQFEAELKTKADMIVIMGDLFDKFVVPPEVVLRAAELCKDNANHDKSIIVLRGNHDASRDADKRSSFDIFSALVDNSYVVTVDESDVTTDGGYLFFGWSPFKPAAEIVASAPRGKYKAAFGHWDIEDYGTTNPNLLPIAELSQLTNTIYTGHIHLPQKLERIGATVHVVGSMQPYAHGEALDEALYLTRTLDEVKEQYDGAYHDYCLRVRLFPGQVLPDEPIDCLQLTVQKVTADQPDEDMQVEIDPFDMQSLFKIAMRDEGLDEKFTALVWAHFEGMRNA